MVSRELLELMQRANQLSTEERLQLIAYLAQSTLNEPATGSVRRSVLEFAGIAPYPLVGEDAQTWVSRTRRESDDQRERALK